MGSPALDSIPVLETLVEPVGAADDLDVQGTAMLPSSSSGSALGSSSFLALGLQSQNSC